MTSPTRTTETTNSGPRKSAGRPATGCDPAVKVRMPADILAAIDRFAGKFAGLDRSAAIRALVELGCVPGARKTKRSIRRDIGCTSARCRLRSGAAWLRQRLSCGRRCCGLSERSRKCPPKLDH
jgi:hypothetical protein